MKTETAIHKFGELPGDAKPVRITRKFGGWSEMEYDAKITRLGVDWYRVKNGMGGRGDREDWVADLPGVCCAVSDYQFRPPYWGSIRYKSFWAAMRGELKSARERLQFDIGKLRGKLAEKVATANMLTKLSAKNGVF